MWPLLLTLAHAGELPDPGRSYDLFLSLDPEERRVDGTAAIRFHNRSQVPLDRIPVHLYLNGYSSGVSTWMTEDRGLRRSAFGEYGRMKRSEDGWGWTRLVSVEAAGPDGSTPVPWEFIAPDDGNPHDRSLAELHLPRPVAPDEVLELTVAFESRLPEISPRTGVAEDFVLAGHAVPTLGLLEIPEPAPEGEPPAQPVWHAHQFHGQTEFFAAFADYRATIQAPEGWRVDGTGTVEPRGELPEEGLWTLTQPMVHDFSFVAVRGMQDRWVDHSLPGGEEVALHFLAPTDRTVTLDRVESIVTHGLDHFATHLGPYPYESLTVVIPPEAAQGSEAVEYAAMFLAQNAGSGGLEHWPFDAVNLHEVVALHELAHQYFQGLVATDEIEHAWLDEGFTDYWAQRALIDRFGVEASMGHVYGIPLNASTMRQLGPGRAREPDHVREPLWSSPSYLLDRGNWGYQAYGRSAFLLHTLDRVFGRERADAVHRAWFERYRFAHPGPEELIALTHEVGGPEMGAFLEQALTEPFTPDFRVDRASTWEREAPVGHVPDVDGSVYVAGDARDDFGPELALPFEPEAAEGRLNVELTEGAIEREPASVQLVELELEGAAADGPLHLSRARIEGPGWATLPVDVVLTFEDGTVLRDVRQTGAVWWEYRVLTHSPLVRVDVDPEWKVLLDAWPENNGLWLEAETDRTTDWAAWFGALSATLGGTAGWWL